VIKDQLNSAPVPCLEGIGWFELTQQLLPCCLSIRCDTLTLGIRAKGTTLSWMDMDVELGEIMETFRMFYKSKVGSIDILGEMMDLRKDIF